MIVNAEVHQLDLDGTDAKPEELHDIWRTEHNPLRILAITPTHPDYGIMPQSLASIRTAIESYPGAVDWMVSSNDNPYSHPYENVNYQHNKARLMLLDGGYDALLSIEADMIVPQDAIQQLLDVHADVVYGLYVWRHKLRRWSAYTELSLWGGQSLSLKHDGSDAREAWGQVLDVKGLGMGCTLIRRKVMETFDFRLHDGRHSWIIDEYRDDFKKLGVSPYRSHVGMTCDDWLFAMDADHYGFKQKANLGVVCGHIHDDEVIWPDPQAKELCRAESIRS